MANTYEPRERPVVESLILQYARQPPPGMAATTWSARSRWEKSG